MKNQSAIFYNYFGTDLAILNHDQMTRTTPELVPPLQASAPQKRENILSFTYDLWCNSPGYASDLELNWFSNLESPRSQSETLTLGH
ncbi:hypothetical protein AVEN_109617-1 [Araneus ventricosus]|uniref:Uncharacterized protein n=1 Tax=Araneus ventricosus TaxID=182803 RepID=A0A4Y2TEX4_ARAVE|nr:hypothetical protein AVEN_109617-1 [Araneus ventricosus]